MGATAQMAMTGLLEEAGFRVRGKRADCAYCSGGSRLTVSFTPEVAFCHRCGWRTNIRRLAREQGKAAPTRRIGRAKVRKELYRGWLSRAYSSMAEEERKLAGRAELAKLALIYFPDMERGWDTLARWYHTQRNFALFFEAAQDRIGRFELYRSWRASNA